MAQFSAGSSQVVRRESLDSSLCRELFLGHAVTPSLSGSVHALYGPNASGEIRAEKTTVGRLIRKPLNRTKA